MKSEAILFKGAALPERSLRRRVLDGVLWLTVVKVFGQAISWAITLYVIRILSPDDYGLMAMAGVYLSFMIIFNEVGLGAAIIQKKDLSQEDLSNIYWAVLFINGALYLLSFLAAPLVAAFYNEPRVTDVIRVASITFILNSLGLVSYNMLTREMIFNRRSQAEMIGNTAGALSTLWLALHGFGVWSLVWGNIIVELVKNVFFVLFYPWRLKFAFSLSKIKDMTHFGSKVALARFFWYFASSMDLLIAGKILGKTQLGYYSIAVQFASVPLFKVVSTITQVAFPAFSEIQDDHALLRRYFLKIVKFIAFVTFPVFFGIFLVADSAVPLLLSEKWQPAILPLQILCAVAAFRAIYTINAPLVVAIGRPGISTLNNLIMAVVLAASFFIGSYYGLTGFAFAWLIFPVLFFVTTSMSVKLISLPLREYFSELRHPFQAAVFMVVVVLLIQKAFLENLGHWPHLVGSAVPGLSSYFLYYALFNRKMFAEARKMINRS